MNRRSLLGSLTWKDNLFFLATGSLLVWSLFLAILSPTTLDFVPTVAFLRVFIVMGALRLVFLSKHTLIIAGVMAGVFALVLTVEGLFLVPSDLITGEPLRNSIFQNILELLDGTFRYALGINAHTPQYDAILSFIIITVLAVFVLVFGLFGFNFYGILSMSVGIFVVVLTSGSFEYSLAFYGFVLAVVSYMVKHLNQKSLKNIYFRE
ncbi:MAG: hypothetical protein FWC69_02210, partial [Defluviitaleaceae bacterium]|nr:hypothetical protein [Defluviitaleaceae bacterium]